MWSVSLLDDPLELGGGSVSVSKEEYHHCTSRRLERTCIAHATCDVSTFLRSLSDDELVQAVVQNSKGGGVKSRVATIAMADYIARTVLMVQSTLEDDVTVVNSHDDGGSLSLQWEALECATTPQRHRSRAMKRSAEIGARRRPKGHVAITSHTPFMLERTDVAVTPHDRALHIYVRVFVFATTTTEMAPSPELAPLTATTGQHSVDALVQNAMATELTTLFKRLSSASGADNSSNSCSLSWRDGLMQHMAVAVLQDELRCQLQRHDEHKAVAFVANGAILPRKSGASAAPMSSPPAIPFVAPLNSRLAQTVAIDVGKVWYPYLVSLLPPSQQAQNTSVTPLTTTIHLTGLLIPRGVSLIVGGGYHGKSTLLRCLAAGVYTKIPGDGREFCVTVDDAVTVRAEDGRYVKNCNVSAFISNLPVANLDTKRFSTGEASGSTSQAANVVEAIEMGASAMLVDEDVSAANFMARDGRMRSLVMDESITPLLYRVNGLYATLGVSSIVVVGGVGDWLDVPDAVILMDRYTCHDATAKARSISNQFSHGHVQYAGRGTVHRLQWEKGGTPTPRRPIVAQQGRHRLEIDNVVVALLDGSDSISLEAVVQSRTDIADTDMNGDAAHDAAAAASAYDDDDECFIDMSRCEQLMGKKAQLYGCGLCLVWLLDMAQRQPLMGMPELLQAMDSTIDERGMLALLLDKDNATTATASWNAMVETLGHVYRPRRFEVGQALTRFRGLLLEPIAVEDDGSEQAAQAEAERKRQELLEIWNNRRKRNTALDCEQIQTVAAPSITGSKV